MKKTKRILRLLKSECGQCSACCRDIVVDITCSDIRRLSEHTGIPADKLVRLYSNAEVDSKEESDWIKFSYGKRTIGLNKKRNGDCIFLSDDKMCTAYHARPITCRVFPITRVLDDKDKIFDIEISDVITDKTIKCKCSNGNGRSYKIFMATSKLADSEYKIFKKKVDKWNTSSRKGVKNDFLNFLELMTSNNRGNPDFFIKKPG